MWNIALQPESRGVQVFWCLGFREKVFEVEVFGDINRKNEDEEKEENKKKQEKKKKQTPSVGLRPISIDFIQF